jgi:hypothetical protein
MNNIRELDLWFNKDIEIENKVSIYNNYFFNKFRFIKEIIIPLLYKNNSNNRLEYNLLLKDNIKIFHNYYISFENDLNKIYNNKDIINMFSDIYIIDNNYKIKIKEYFYDSPLFIFKINNILIYISFNNESWRISVDSDEEITLPVFTQTISDINKLQHSNIVYINDLCNLYKNNKKKFTCLFNNDYDFYTFLLLLNNQSENKEYNYFIGYSIRNKNKICNYGELLIKLDKKISFEKIEEIKMYILKNENDKNINDIIFYNILLL